jgi:hypothetical protein
MGTGRSPDSWERWLALAFWAIRQMLGLTLMAAWTVYVVIELASGPSPAELLRYLAPWHFPPN